MSGLEQRLYHALPPALQSAAASLRGYQLRRWRYGAETEGLVGEAIARERWNPGEWAAYTGEKLEVVLHGAATRVPLYRDQWAARRARGDRASWNYLENWPILEKETVRTHSASLLADGFKRSALHHLHSSGSTGTPVNLWQSRDASRQWYALFEARWRQWHGVTLEDRWAMLGGQLVVPVSRRNPPFWVWNRAMRQLYMSSYHLSPEAVPHYVRALHDHRVVYLWGYTSALYALAEAMIRAGARPPRLKVALANAEPVYPYQRSAIEEAFGCPLRETYGMTEIVAASGECPAGSRHLWPEVGVVEIVDEGNSVTPGEVGDIVATGLLNPAMPLVRYRVGDRGAIAPAASECSCGRTLPLLGSIDGRVDDVLYGRDGRRIGRLDPVFKGDLAVREIQLVQTSLDRLLVRYVPGAGFTVRSKSEIASRIKDRMGQIEVSFEEAGAIERGSNGKFRAVVCKLSPEEIASAR